MKDNEKAKKNKDRHRTLRYMSIGMNMVYTLCTPMVLMACLYFFVIEKKFGHHPLVLVIMIMIGLVSGYYSFYKLVKEIGK
jgi:F0F1-type ATP synthase assembly protein I